MCSGNVTCCARVLRLELSKDTTDRRPRQLFGLSTVDVPIAVAHRNAGGVGGGDRCGARGLGFGRIVASEDEAPNR
jgi:hypothetical protein